MTPVYHETAPVSTNLRRNLRNSELRGAVLAFFETIFESYRQKCMNRMTS